VLQRLLPALSVCFFGFIMYQHGVRDVSRLRGFCIGFCLVLRDCIMSSLSALVVLTTILSLSSLWLFYYPTTAATSSPHVRSARNFDSPRPGLSWYRCMMWVPLSSYLGVLAVSVVVRVRLDLRVFTGAACCVQSQWVLENWVSWRRG
jgi:hypothetical protein